ncbi:MAG: mycothiol synthase [Candidatus Nanopelagicales bacterium]|jgi:mycothiol synthase
MAIDWEVLARLDDADVHDVGVLVEQVTEADGVRPLSEHVMLHLRYGGDSQARHVLAREDGVLIGYGHIDTTDAVQGSSAEIAVAPQARRRGVAHRTVELLWEESPDGRLRLWSHGDQTGAAALTASLGFQLSRTLYQLRRPLAGDLPPVVLPDGVRLRSFLPGLDDEEWVALNARAFVDLPDQGGWTLHDLHVRMREPWFDPSGFLVAVEDVDGAERMVGFHWTKVHGAHEHEHSHAHSHDAAVDGHGGHAHEHEHSHDHEGGPEHVHDEARAGRSVVGHGHAHDPIGEVYVVGVDPSQQGRGLGRALTLAGLAHLRAEGLPDAMLYVDARNTSAIALYESLGFVRYDVDVEYSAPAR